VSEGRDLGYDYGADIDTDMVLEQGDELLRSSRDLIADIDRQLSNTEFVNKAGDTLRTTDDAAGDS
jgi:hypothetical protein